MRLDPYKELLQLVAFWALFVGALYLCINVWRIWLWQI